MTSDAAVSSTDPLRLFQDWLDGAGKSEPNDPNAAALATASSDGRPSVRMVLVKHVDYSGFRFFTNTESQKGRELTDNPFAALCFHWKSVRRQVRVEGPVTQLSEEITAEYFHSRSRASQISAAVSRQSRPLADRSTLEQAVQEFTRSHPGEVPLPETWRGYALKAEQIEFWEDGADRLHQRRLYRAEDTGWTCELLYP